MTKKIARLSSSTLKVLKISISFHNFTGEKRWPYMTHMSTTENTRMNSVYQCSLASGFSSLFIAVKLSSLFSGVVFSSLVHGVKFSSLLIGVTLFIGVFITVQW